MLPLLTAEYPRKFAAHYIEWNNIVTKDLNCSSLNKLRLIRQTETYDQLATDIQDLYYTYSLRDQSVTLLSSLKWLSFWQCAPSQAVFTNSALGRVGLVVAISVRLSVCLRHHVHFLGLSLALRSHDQHCRMVFD